MNKQLPVAIALVVMRSTVIGSTFSALAQQEGLGAFRTRTSVTKLKDYPSKPKDAPVELLASPPQDRKYEDVCMINAKTSGDLIAAHVDVSQAGHSAGEMKLVTIVIPVVPL